jgi:hypothetical protein
LRPAVFHQEAIYEHVNAVDTFLRAALTQAAAVYVLPAHLANPSSTQDEFNDFIMRLVGFPEIIRLLCHAALTKQWVLTEGVAKKWMGSGGGHGEAKAKVEGVPEEIEVRDSEGSDAEVLIVEPGGTPPDVQELRSEVSVCPEWECAGNHVLLPPEIQEDPEDPEDLGVLGTSALRNAGDCCEYLTNFLKTRFQDEPPFVIVSPYANSALMAGELEDLCLVQDSDRYYSVHGMWSSRISPALHHVRRVVLASARAYMDAVVLKDRFAVVQRFRWPNTTNVHMAWILHGLAGRYMDPVAAGTWAAEEMLETASTSTRVLRFPQDPVTPGSMQEEAYVRHVLVQDVFDVEDKYGTALFEAVAAVSSLRPDNPTAPSSSFEGPLKFFQNATALITRAVEAGALGTAPSIRLKRSRAHVALVRTAVGMAHSLARLCHGLVVGRVSLAGLVKFVDLGDARDAVGMPEDVASLDKHSVLFLTQICNRAALLVSDLTVRAGTLPGYTRGVHKLFHELGVKYAPRQDVLLNVMAGKPWADTTHLFSAVVDARGHYANMWPLWATVIPKWARSTQVKAHHMVKSAKEDVSPPRMLGSSNHLSTLPTFLITALGVSRLCCTSGRDFSGFLGQMCLELQTLVTSINSEVTLEVDRAKWRMNAAVMTLVLDVDRQIRRNVVLEETSMGTTTNTSTPTPTATKTSVRVTKRRRVIDDDDDDVDQAAAGKPSPASCAFCYGDVLVAPFGGGCAHPNHLACRACVLQNVSERAHGQFEDAHFQGGRNPFACLDDTCSFVMSEAHARRVLEHVPFCTQVVLAHNEFRRLARAAGDKACPVCGMLTCSPPSDCVLTCEHCLSPTCVRCKEPAHYGVVCRLALAADPVAVTMEELLSEAKLVRCPGCRVSYHKQQGCNHMTCVQCKTNFCYLCGVVLQGDRDLGAHFERCLAGHQEYELGTETLRMITVLQKSKETGVTPLSDRPVSADVVEHAVAALQGTHHHLAQAEEDL